MPAFLDIFIYKDCINTHTFACGETGRIGEKAQDPVTVVTSRERDGGQVKIHTHLPVDNQAISGGLGGGTRHRHSGYPQGGTQRRQGDR